MPFPADLFARTRGFLEESEGQRLYQAAKEAARIGPCLEIGGYCGRSTVCLGTACREAGSVLFSVDHHRGSEEQQPGEAYFDPVLLDPSTGRVDSLPAFRRMLALASLEETVVPIVCASVIAARQWATPLSLVFIDGGHSLSDAFADYNGWARHVVPGGCLLIHDVFLDPGQGGQAPRKVRDAALFSGLFVEEDMEQGLAVLRRLSPDAAPPPGFET